MQKSILFFFLKNKMLSIAFILYIVLFCDFLIGFYKLNMLSCPRTAPVINNGYNMRADHFPALLQGLD